MRLDAIMIKERDNVATALRDIQPKEKVFIGMGEARKEVTVQEQILFGHKFAVKEILEGQNVTKYGETIGRATQDIRLGHHAHIQNIESLSGRGDLES
jgi:altronate dehydratase small subunit